MGTTRDGILLQNVAAGTFGALPTTVGGTSYLLKGGRYFITINATFGSAQLNKLGADGTTWVPAAAALTTAGVLALDLGVGYYQWVLTAGSAYNIELNAISVPV